MTELLTAAQMRAIEQAAIESGEVTDLELMERAGKGVVEAILEEWPEMAKRPHKAVVLCGPGNNGGDGFVVARLLKQSGWEVEVFLYGEVEKLPPDAKVNAERWLEMGEVEDIAGAHISSSEVCNIIVDAVFGTGLNKCLPKVVADFFNTHLQHKIVAVDILSGRDADSGKTIVGDGISIASPELTVTFHLRKNGHYLGVSEQLGRLKVSSIGLENSDKTRNLKHLDEYVRTTNSPYHLQIDKSFSDHKYTHGHALILSGPAGRTGAARLAARGALRIGAGLVSLACPQEAMAENAAQLTAIMLSSVEDAEALHAVLQDERINALCVGPSLGLDARAVGLIAAALTVEEHKVAPEQSGGEKRPLPDGAGRKLVLDADALTILSKEPELFNALHKNCVLTPHAGEFKRLFPDIMAKLEAPSTTGPAYSKIDATREAAARAGCTVLFKGADTVIADQTGRAAINSAHYERSAPWLATAGSGDVLAGFITGLLARGFAPMQAAESAAWLHVECALKFGPGLIAEDLPEQLPAVFRDLKL